MSEAALASMDDLEAAKTAAIRRLRGTVLEIGAGSGANFAHLARDTEWIGLEPAAKPRRALEAKARRLGKNSEVLAATAERIPLDDASVDAVLATTVLCSVTDQTTVLREVARVLKPGGRFVFAEHVDAPVGTFAHRLLRIAKPFTKAFDRGCDPTRDTASAIEASPLHIDALTRLNVRAIGSLAIPAIVVEGRRL